MGEHLEVGAGVQLDAERLRQGGLWAQEAHGQQHQVGLQDLLTAWHFQQVGPPAALRRLPPHLRARMLVSDEQSQQEHGHYPVPY